MRPDTLTFRGDTLHNVGKINTQKASLSGSKLNNSGILQSAQFNQIQFKNIDNHGGVASESSYQIKTNQLKNSGSIYSAANLRMHIAEDFVNDGILSATADFSIDTPELKNQQKGQIQGGRLNLAGKTLRNLGTILQSGSDALHIDSPYFNNQGQLGSINKQAAFQENDTSQATALVLKSDANAGQLHYQHVDNSGRIDAAGPIHLKVQDHLTNTDSIYLYRLDYQGDILTNHGILHADEASIAASALDNRAGTLTAGRFAPLKFTQKFDNTSGRIQSYQDLDLTVNILNNQGTEAMIAAQANLNLHADAINNEGGLFSGKNLVLDTHNVHNSGMMQAGKKISSTLDYLDNKGTIRAETLQFELENLNNQGSMSQTGSGALMISAGDLHNHKDAVLGKALDLLSEKDTLDAESHIAHPVQTADDGYLRVRYKLNNQGRITANGHSFMEIADQFINQGSIGLHIFSMDRAHFNNEGNIYADIATLSGQSLHNSGKLQADLFKRFDYQQLINNQGVIAGQQNFAIHTAKLNNHETAIIHGGHDIDLVAHSIENAGSIYAQEHLAFPSENIQLSNSGQISAGQQLDLHSHNINNLATGKLAGQEVTLNNEGLNNKGYIQGALLKVNNKNTNNLGNIIFSEAIQFDHGNLSNKGYIGTGTLLATQKNLINKGVIDVKTMELHSDTFNNQGTVNSKDALTIHASQTLNQKDGHIQSGKKIYFDSQNIDNQGTILTDQWLGEGEELNNQGTIAAIDTLTSAYQTIRNQGQLAAGALRMRVDRLNNSGSIRQIGADSLTLNSTTLTNLEQAAIGNTAASKTNLSTETSIKTPKNHGAGYITATEIINRNQGSINSAGQLNVQIEEALNNQSTIIADTFNFNGKQLKNQGILYAQKWRHLTLSELANQGTLGSGSALSIDTLILNNGEQAKLFVNDTLYLNSEQINNAGFIQGKKINIHSKQTIHNDGGLQADENIILTTEKFNNQEGTLYSAQDLDINVIDARNSGNIIAKNKLKFIANDLNNQGHIHANNGSIRISNLANNLKDGRITADKTQSIESGSLNNAGEIAASHAVKLTTHQLDNYGKLISQDFDIHAENLHNSGHIMQTGQAHLILNTVELENQKNASILSGGGTAALDTQLKESTTPTETEGVHQLHATKRIINSGKITAGGNIELDIKEHVDNAGKLRMDTLHISPAFKWTLHDSSDIAVRRAQFTMPNAIVRGKLNTQILSINSQRFINYGSLNYNHANWHNITAWMNHGAVSTPENLIFKNIEFANSHGASLTTSGQLTFEGSVFNNEGSLLTGGDQKITVDEFNNSGVLATNASQHWKIKTLNNQSRGEINAALLDWQVEQLNNQGAIFHTGNSTLTIDAKKLINQNAILGHSSVELPNQAAGLKPESTDSTSTNTTAASSGDSLIQVHGVLNNQGKAGQKAAIVSNQDVVLNISEVLENQTGAQIQVQQLNHQGDRLVTQQGSTIDADHLKLNIHHLNNAGELLSSNDIALSHLDSITNSGVVATLGTLDIEHHATLQNSGALQSSDLKLNVKHLDNRGRIESSETATITTQDTLENKGRIASRELNLNIPQLDNAGSIFAHNDYTLPLSIQINNSGTLSGANQLSFKEASLNNSGAIYGYDLSITTPQFNHSGTISAQHNLYIERPSAWQANGSLTVVVQF